MDLESFPPVKIIAQLLRASLIKKVAVGASIWGAQNSNPYTGEMEGWKEWILTMQLQFGKGKGGGEG